MKLRGSTFLWLAGLNLSKSTQMNVSGFTSAQNNPADHASRGIGICNQNKVQEWLLGPKFPWKPEEKQTMNRTYTQVNSDDPELKKDLVVSYISATSDVLSALEMHVSYWSRMVRVVALVIRFKNNLLSAIKHKASNKTLNENQSLLDTSLMKEAKNIIIKMAQKRSFNAEFKWLKLMNDKTWGNKALDKRNKISRLDPFLDKDGIIRVRVRLDNCFINSNCKHPILLPKDGKVTTLIIQHHHKMAAHVGRGITLNQIRSLGYWRVSANSAVKNFIFRCVDCRRLRGRIGEQKMADLPSCRSTETGPFIVKQRRSEVKRYGAIFTCMASRAVHIEVTFSLDSDYFILALRQLIARRGNVRSIYSDNGSNFIGAERELSKAYEEMDDDKIQSFMQEHGRDWIKRYNNPPLASHMRDGWERQIRSAGAILSSLLKTHGESLDDESLITLMTEVEGILNSRPLTVETINDPTSFQPLSLFNLLTMKSKVVSPPPGKFLKSDVYSKRRWRRIQHIANEFWSHWRKEYLQSLQERQKWTSKRRNFRVDNIVLLKQSDVPQIQWSMGRGIDVNNDRKDLVQTVTLKIGESAGNENSKRKLE